MSILFIYDKPIDPQSGGTERATHLVMTGLANRGYSIAGFLAICQESPREIYDVGGRQVDDLYSFLTVNKVDVVVNQIGYSKWLLEEFFERGGARWKEEGGRIVTKLHFDPLMFPTSVSELLRPWPRMSAKRKLRRLGRLALLPLERRRAARTLREAYQYLLEKSDAYIILSESHRNKLIAMSGTRRLGRVHAIANPNTFPAAIAPERVPLKSKTVLIVSRLDEPQKRVSLALLAWGKVMQMGGFLDWNLKVIGDGEFRDDYRQLIAKKQIRNVEFLGRLDPEPFYEDAALYLHTAKREGWGLTIAEAMQKGVVPLVMRSSPVFDELIADGDNGVLVENGNVRLFAARLAELMRSRKTRERLALSAIAASKNHDQDRIFEKWSVLIGSQETTEHKPCVQKS